MAKGKAAGEELGGRIRTLVRSVTVRCDYTKIPEKIEVDVTALKVGDFARISTATPIKGVEVIFEHDFNVITCYGKRGPKQLDVPTAAPAAAPEEGAAPAAEES